MGAFRSPILELRNVTDLNYGFLLEISPRVEQPFAVVYFYDHNSIQDGAADFSRQNCGQIARQIPRFKATDSSRFILLLRPFIY